MIKGIRAIDVWSHENLKDNSEICLHNSICFSKSYKSVANDNINL